MMMEILQLNNELLALLSSFMGGGALGGFISNVINRKENKRIKKSEAVQKEALARKVGGRRGASTKGVVAGTGEPHPGEQQPAALGGQTDAGKQGAEGEIGSLLPFQPEITIAR